jgi:tetratricopeptide (TPR) repeat protein
MRLERIPLFAGSFLLLTGAAFAQSASYDPHKLMLARSHYTKGMKLIAEQKKSEGEQQLLEAVKIFPELVEGYVELGNLSMERKEFREGLDRYLKARDALAGLQGLKRLQEVERQRRIQESIDLLNEQISQLSRSGSPANQGRIQEAMVRLDKLQQEKTNQQPTTETPFTPEVLFLVGTAYMKLEQFEEAGKQLQDALVLRPKFAEAHNNLAVVLYYRKDYSGCWSHLRAAEALGMRIDPQFVAELTATFPEPDKASPTP